MTLPSSGSLAFTQIQSEFSSRGTSNSFNAYYRGGSIVPNTSGTQNISTTQSGLAMSQFYGASNYINMSGSATSGSSFSCVYTKPPFSSCSATGTVTANISNGSGSYSYSWSVTAGHGNLSNANSQTCTISWSAASDSSAFTVQCVVGDGTGNTLTVTFSSFWSIASNA